jgi:hypothetical protein
MARFLAKSPLITRKSFLKLLSSLIAISVLRLESSNKKATYRILIVPPNGKSNSDYLADLSKWARVELFQETQNKFKATGQLLNVYIDESVAPFSYQYEFASLSDLLAFDNELKALKVVDRERMKLLGYKSFESYG